MALPDNPLFNYDPYDTRKPAGVQPVRGLQRRYNPGGQTADYGSGYNPGGQPANYGAAFAAGPAAPVRAVSALNSKRGMQRRAPEPVFIDPTDPASFANSPPNRSLRRRGNLNVPAGPESVVVEPSNANLALGLRRRASGPVGIGADINPMSNQGELMRRLEISQNSFKGSPQARRLAAEAILGQLQDDRTSRLAAQETGDRADLVSQRAALDAAEGFADRKLRADMFNTEVTENREALKRKGQITPKDLIELQIAGANAQREADRYELERPGIVDTQAEKRRDYYIAQGLSPQQAEERIAIDFNRTNIDPDSSVIASAGKASILGDIEGKLNRGPGWFSALGDDEASYIPFARRELPPGSLKDASQVKLDRNGMLRRLITGEPYSFTAYDEKGNAVKTYGSEEDADRIRGLRKREGIQRRLPADDDELDGALDRFVSNRRG